MKKQCDICKREVNETMHKNDSYTVDYYESKKMIDSKDVKTLKCKECHNKKK